MEEQGRLGQVGKGGEQFAKHGLGSAEDEGDGRVVASWSSGTGDRAENEHAYPEQPLEMVNEMEGKEAGD